MKKILIISLLIIFVVSPNVLAVNGYIALDYDTLNKTGAGEIYLYKSFNKFTIGGLFKTELMGFNLKGGYIPAGIPRSQTYDLILKYKLSNDITVRMIEGCKHYFSQSGISGRQDDTYIKIGAKYEF